VFDVSEDYRGHWMSWLPKDACATYEMPSSWHGRFDVVTAHYVMEHVGDPVAVLSELRALLAPGGKLFFSVPDWTQNSGDLLVVDHINHFSETSIRTALWRAGLGLDLLASTRLPATFVVVCSKSASAAAPATDKVHAEVDAARAACSFWTNMVATLDESAALRRDRSSAIFGVGFYGSLVHSRVGKRVPVACFLDNNPHSWSLPHFGLPVRPPAEMPEDVRTVYVGLNPSAARSIVAQTPGLNRNDVDLVFLDQAA
jgi:SAM-dependent methyltransferase